MKFESPKKRILHEFEMMMGFEASAKKSYLKVAADPKIENQKAKETFARIAKEEQAHIGMVQKIIQIIETEL